MLIIIDQNTTDIGHWAKPNLFFRLWLFGERQMEAIEKSKIQNYNICLHTLIQSRDRVKQCVVWSVYNYVTCFCQKLGFLIAMSLQSNVVDLRYFKLRILEDQIILVWNIKSFHYQVAKIKELTNYGLLKKVVPLWKLFQIKMTFYFVNVKFKKKFIFYLFVGHQSFKTENKIIIFFTNNF